ncbi:anthranilate synthase, aminase component [Halarchaeum acidiphilum MH1-52-1]|uniref:Anthranilate synthase component 1 n=2 Tax=Halarchaeum acidiphilum TaxID=489138 RepID=U2YFK5_9EURY|nr:anthranilate synthase component I [Halarchaeum acidiphilum]GAD52821.1 anthranilate synthase, aminase component [Halarchaeum acidiphilum MH1-52-1]
MGLDVARDEFAERAAGDGPGVVYAEATIDADVSPLGAYAALADGDYAFLLESAEKTAASDPGGAFRPRDVEAGERHARYSFVGYDPDAVVSATPDGATVERLADTRAARAVTPGDGDVLDQLRGALPDAERRGFPESERQLLDGGLVGFVAYDAVYDLWLDEVGVERPETRVPDAEFVLNTRVLRFDRATGTLSLVCTPVVDSDADDVEGIYDDLVAEVARVEAALADANEPETGGFERTDETAGPRDEYEDAVERAKDAVLDGEIYQGVISRTRELAGDLDPLGLYASLREINPSPYMYVLKHGDRTVVGASPETLTSVHGSEVLNNPIAGTCPRGTSPVEDRRLAGEMLADEKERAEHTMLVDLARNDVRRVSDAGSVRVPEFMRVLKYSHVQHIESTVTGRLRDDFDAFDAIRAAFPAGTLSGAPKVRAMELIDELERDPRGIYGGGVGYVSWTGDADIAICIRTATVEHGAGGTDTGTGGADVVRVRAGAGIVADSDPTSEYEETEKKMGGVLDALDAITRTPGEVER